MMRVHRERMSRKWGLFFCILCGRGDSYTTNKRCKISKVCSRKSYSDRNKRDSLAYDIYDRLQETKRGNITQHYCSILIPVDD